MKASHPELFSGNGDRQFRIKDRTLAILDLAIPFHIIEINKTGLVFRYVGNEQWFKDPGKLDVSYEGFSLRNLPVQSVADYRIPTDMVQTRYHCVTYNTLSPSQTKQLDQFIGLCVQ
ncbi:MAG: hypothetical protein KKA54_03785 [Proteobacteria bacterium]|nr:hypothetical protein [Pseudomonadota bacterium]MBU0965484.1 hypothetical protein [Pseudomonadota bacterium]